eukprot:COSAG01_NODE_19369_length_1013_cov_39.487965_2_plen_40_part_01
MTPKEIAAEDKVAQTLLGETDVSSASVSKSCLGLGVDLIT